MKTVTEIIDSLLKYEIRKDEAITFIRQLIHEQNSFRAIEKSASADHVGTNTYRLNMEGNELEKNLAEQWRLANENPSNTLSVILGSFKDPATVSKRDAIVAATVMQWVGTPVGRSFVERVYEKHDQDILNYRKTTKAKP